MVDEHFGASGQADATEEPMQEGYAHIWGYSVLHFDLKSWFGRAWFSTPTMPGQLSTTGGWGLYFLDKLGVLACGSFWPWVGWSAVIALAIFFAILSIIVIGTICRPIRSFCTCCCQQTRAVAREVGEFLPELHVGGSYETLSLRGPSTREGVDSNFYQRGIKGRGSERKPNDVVVLMQDQAARIKPEGDHWARVDRYGLWVRVREVKGASSRTLRQLLDHDGKVHLCREQNCPLEQAPTPGLHCKAYAAVDANGLVDLGAYAGWSTRRFAVLLGRWIRRVLHTLKWLTYHLSGLSLVCSACRKPRPPRTIQEGEVTRPLDPDSESEVEPLEDPCEAVMVGLEVGGKPRALASDPCMDQASGESVRLLESDREMSDVRGRTSVRLCDHHRQLYTAACSGRKCSVLACYEAASGSKQGVPLCRQHLMEIGAGAKPTRKVSWQDDTLRREESIEPPSPRTPRVRNTTKARSTSAEPQSSKQHQLEGHLTRGPCVVLLRLRNQQLPHGRPRWLLMFGYLNGFAEEGRAQERIAFCLPESNVQGTVLGAQLIGEPKVSQAGKISKDWVQNFFKADHAEEAARGVSVIVGRITNDQRHQLSEWQGRFTDGAPPSLALDTKCWKSILEQEVLPHSDAYLRVSTPCPNQEEFMTPPRPQASDHEEEYPGFPEVPKRDDEEALQAAHGALLQYGEDERDEEMVHTIAAAFDVDPSQLAAHLPKHQPSLGSPDKEIADNAQLFKFPSVIQELGAPPGLEQKGESTTAGPPSGLVAPVFQRSSNPLLQRETTVSRPSVVNLFPKSSGGVKRLSALQPAQRVGATYGEALGDSSQMQHADRIIHAIDGLRKSQDEDKSLVKGALSSIKEAEKMDVFLARGCGTLSIEIAPGVYGKELFHAGKRIAQHARHMLHTIKWPVLMTNRLLLGVAGLWWGGPENYTLHASDCVTARSEQLDTWVPSSDHKAEPRSKTPGVFNTWLRYAENSIRVFGSCYGTEHMQERNECLQAIKEAHEEDEHAFPASYCIELFEELTAVWCEEVRESRRKLCALLGTENPRLEDLKLLALAPGPSGAANFQFPRVWDLSDPEGYYQKVVIPRQERQMSRLLHKQLHDHNLKQKKTAGPAEDATDAGDENKTGKAPRLNLKNTEHPSASKAAYPAGKRLPQQEASRSVEHAPRDAKMNRPICWDAATHMGCAKGAKCPHAHEPLPGLAKLDYTVAMQVIRRGGLKGGPKIDPKEVDGRVAQLRQQAKQEHDEKKQPPKAKAKPKPKGKAKAGKDEDKEARAGESQWEVPEDYAVPLTRMEEDLNEAVQGPDPTWLEVPDRQAEQEPEPSQGEQSEEELQRKQRWEKLEASGSLEPLRESSDYLHSHVVARMLDAEDRGEKLPLATCLEEAAELGHPALAEEACQILTTMNHVPKAGHQADAEFTPPKWTEGMGVGELLLHGQLEEWGPISYRDYQDKLPVEMTGVPMNDGAEVEERQCLPLHVGIGIALAADSAASPEIVLGKAAEVRAHLWQEAAQAHAHLGDAPPWISDTEHFLRQNVHDCLFPHHEKDYRALQTLAGSLLDGHTLVVLRISNFGRLEADVLHGKGADPGQLVFVTIHRGHMRLLQPNYPEELFQGLQQNAKVARVLQAEPWQEALDRGAQEDALVPSKLPNCARCQQQHSKPYRVGETQPKPPASFDTCLQEAPQDLSSPEKPLKQRLAFAFGPRGQEVFAGWGGWTKGLEYQGIPCNQPIEYFEDPLRQIGYKPDHDTRDPQVRQKLLGLASAPPGPDVPNVWQLGVVCTSFCDHQITNGGTRTWDQPQGDGTKPSEVQGNEDAEFAAHLCTTLHENGRVFGLESSAPTGRYPKLWDLPCMVKLRERTGAKIVPMAMCAWGLAPPGAPPGEYHRKRSWWMVSKELYP